MLHLRDEGIAEEIALDFEIRRRLVFIGIALGRRVKVVAKEKHCLILEIENSMHG